MITKEFSRAGSVVDRINAKYADLRNAEKTVADYVMSHLNQRLDFSITELASEIGVSEATISRLSRSLGYRGYQDLKISIAAGLGGDGEIPNLPAEIKETDGVLEVSQKLGDALASSLRDTAAYLDRTALEAAVEALSAARHIMFIGVGGAASICLEASHLFHKVGRVATFVPDGYGQIVTASTVGQEHTVVAVSHTGQTRSVAHALKLARANGAHTVAITSDRRSPVAESAETTLLTWKQEKTSIPLYGDFIEGRTCQLYLIDLLFLMVLFRSENGEKKNLHRTGAALEGYYSS